MKEQNFQIRDLVLKWNKRREGPSKHDKFDFLWFGPFIIHNLAGENYYVLMNIQDDILPAFVNERFLKHYIQA